VLGLDRDDLAAADPDRPFVTCGSRTATRAEVESRANRLARVYRDLGVTPGRFVTIGLPNSVEFIEALFAVWKLGAVPQPLSHAVPAHERAEILALADPPRSSVLTTPARHAQASRWASSPMRRSVTRRSNRLSSRRS
jgi:bile acid-coenzyme A ligase